MDVLLYGWPYVGLALALVLAGRPGSSAPASWCTRSCSPRCSSPASRGLIWGELLVVVNALNALSVLLLGWLAERALGQPEQRAEL